VRLLGGPRRWRCCTRWRTAPPPGAAEFSARDLHAQAAAEIWHYYARDAVAAPPVLLDGHAIMALLDLPPGPRIGALKDALLEATAAGEVATVAEAEALVRRLQHELADG
jgi:hypothetical protein